MVSKINDETPTITNETVVGFLSCAVIYGVYLLTPTVHLDSKVHLDIVTCNLYYKQFQTPPNPNRRS